MIIAIDGPAGAGKSTIAKLLAEKLEFLYVDTGAMYRALTLKVLLENVNFEDQEKLVALASKTKIRLQKNEDSSPKVFLDDKDVTLAIRKPEVTNSVFHVANIHKIRNIMVNLQREYALLDSIVMEGRDIGTVVFPKAQKKFYLDAKPKVRAQRRMVELKQKGINLELDEVIAQIEERDSKDKAREYGALKKADDAIYVDTSDMSIPDVVECLLRHINDEKKK